jgi:hypothetical protein
VDQVWEELHFCSKQVGDVRIEDARFEIGAIDLFGPLSTEVLFSVLNVGKGVCSKIWEQLKGLGDPGSLPLGAVLNLDLTDPRTTYPLLTLKTLMYKVSRLENENTLPHRNYLLYSKNGHNISLAPQHYLPPHPAPSQQNTSKPTPAVLSKKPATNSLIPANLPVSLPQTP